MNDKFTSMIGFAKRAGKIVYGYDNLLGARRVKLYAVSTTASEKLQRNMQMLADKFSRPLVTAELLETIVGNNCKALGITDANMAKAMLDCAAGNADRYRI